MNCFFESLFLASCAEVQNSKGVEASTHKNINNYLIVGNQTDVDVAASRNFHWNFG